MRSGGLTVQRFEDRSVIVTGAASGIGRSTAERLAAEGALLTISDVNAEGLEQTAATCRESGAVVTSLVSDVSDEAAVAELIGAAVADHGRLDVLVNVAGILQFKDFRLTTLQDFQRIIGVNLTGTFLTCRDAMPHLLESQGNIVNISSTAALAGHPWTSSYSASKGGVLALTLTLAVEFGKLGVRCNAVAPGSNNTPIQEAFELPEGADAKLLRRIMPLDKMRGPENVAGAVAFLGSDDAAHVNGEVLRVDGGALA
jgi:meso-butanediol dehydrogenase/(S,S)-butanediol dehydrogenase/diacetyl reductase